MPRKLRGQTVKSRSRTGSDGMRTLYLCYFGLREPLVQTQVVPYLRELRAAGIDVYLLTFEPGWPGSWSATDRAATSSQIGNSPSRWPKRSR